MSTDLFGRRALEFGGAFAADSACINLNLSCIDDESPLSIEGLLTQQINIQYQQPITRLYEVGTQKTYFVAGRPQGQANIARVLGPGNIMAEFYTCLGDVCNAASNDICLCVESNCIGNQDQNFSGMNICLKNVVLQSVGFAIQAQDMIINEQTSLMFTSLLAEDSAGCACTDEIEVTCDCFTG